MPSLTRRSRRSSSRSSSNHSNRPSYRDAAQQTSERPSHRRSVSPSNRRSRRTPSPSPVRPSATHPNRKRFGLNIHDNPPRIGKFDFEEKYPEDPIYEELGPNARAWRVNLDECEVYDNDMVVEARDGLDLLLVFAGLFSAVLTTFVVQTSQALSNNFPAVSTSLLLEMVSLQRAFINGTSIDDIASSEMTSGPSAFDVWVNALWFTSLTLSLGTALMAVLVKQWLYQYMSIISGTARDRSLIRFYRFDGLRKWHVLTIIGTLPIVLHVALGLFLAGLVVFLVPLNIPLAGIIGFITVIIYTVYTVSNILPIIYSQCPYRTPFSDILNVLMRPIFTLLSFISSSAPARDIHAFFTFAVASVARLYRLSSSLISDLLHALPSESSTSPKIVFQTLKEAERIAATGNEVVEALACDALMWLYQMTSNPPTKNIILQSLGCLSDDVSNRLTTIHTDLQRALHEVLGEPLYEQLSLLPDKESRAERLLRAQRHIKEPDVTTPRLWDVDAVAFDPPFHTLVSILAHVPQATVKSRGGDSRSWNSCDLLKHLMDEHSAGRPVLLPTTLWQQLMPTSHIDYSARDINCRLLLCRLALQSWDNDERTPLPFSGGVLITHNTVPLKRFVTNMLPQDNLPVSEPLHQLSIINDYVVSKLLTNWTVLTADDAAVALMDLWHRIPVRPDDNTPFGDSQAICWRAERCIMEVFDDDWWEDLPSGSNVLNRCYDAVISRYQRYRTNVVPSPELFTKLFSELCWSADVERISGNDISHILGDVFSTDVNNTTAHYTLLCGSESPLFSPQTKLPLYDSTHICHVMTAFVDGLARASPALINHCMELLCATPDRLFTICRVLCLKNVNLLLFHLEGTKKVAAEYLIKLVSLDSKHKAWQGRKHFLIGIEPWEWPHFLIPEDHEHIARARYLMQFALEVLDDFFASLENSPSAAPPSELRTEPFTRQVSVKSTEPVRISPPWKRIRHLVLSTRAFRHMMSSSSPAGIELASPSDRFEDHPALTLASDLLAIEHAPPTVSNAVGSSNSHAIMRPGDDIV